MSVSGHYKSHVLNKNGFLPLLIENSHQLYKLLDISLGWPCLKDCSALLNPVNKKYQVQCLHFSTSPLFLNPNYKLQTEYTHLRPSLADFCKLVVNLHFNLLILYFHLPLLLHVLINMNQLVELALPWPIPRKFNSILS